MPEKHLTLNTKMRGPDHSASLDPMNFKRMCKKIREVELLLGNATKAERILGWTPKIKFNELVEEMVNF